MYTPAYHAFNDIEKMRAHIAAHSLGAWVCHAHGQLIANHIPFVLDAKHGSHGRLLAHVSRANPVWRQLIGGAPSVVMFMGPSAYITPSWYPGKRQHGKVVPTWNYVTVHAHGMARAMEDTCWILDVLNRLTDTQESQRTEPWKVSDAPSAYIEKMLRAVVGIEITIDRVEGRLKVNQDEDEQDRRGTVEGLQHSTDASTQVLASLVLGELEETTKGNLGNCPHR
ncbi:FMN-binding negative transcriptional regulator [Limnohabitans sp. Rim8]|uniref:FMN-binding negative transcriptional regulator n=1 Tax=Limnohabitans sp. Rim8 TaxID=1100718 RepID=UPI0025DCD573|nr:FMN-binding negative transcriptional regulator [Limnohabitans sp. Rim8]